MGSARASRSARISSSIVNCSRGSRRFPGSLEGERVYEVGPGPGGLTHALLDAGATIVAVERDRRCLPALAELQQKAGAKLESSRGMPCRSTSKRSPGKARMSSPICPTMSGLRSCSSGWLRLAALVAITDLDVSERSCRAYRGSARKRSVRASVGRRPWRSRPPGDGCQSLGVRAAAEGDFGSGPYRTDGTARRSEPEIMERLTGAAFGQRRKMLRSSLKQMPGALEAAELLGIDTRRRAETLSIAEWVSLARKLSA